MNDEETVLRAQVNPGTLARFTYDDGSVVIGSVVGQDGLTGDWIVKETAEMVSPLEVPGWEAGMIAELWDWPLKDLLVEAVGRRNLLRGITGAIVGQRVGLCAMVMLQRAETHPGVMVPREHPVQKIVLRAHVKEVTVLTDEYIDGVLGGIASYG